MYSAVDRVRYEAISLVTRVSDFFFFSTTAKLYIFALQHIYFPRRSQARRVCVERVVTDGVGVPTRVYMYLCTLQNSSRM